MKRIELLPAVCLALLACDGGSVSTADEASDAVLVRLVEAEDARPGPNGIGLLLEARESEDPRVVRAAYRALGRLEDPELLDEVAPGVTHLDPGVRAEAVNAVAQAVWQVPSPEALELLVTRAEVEQDPGVAAVLARSLGRLEPVDGEDIAERVRTILSLRDAGVSAVLGVAMGLHNVALVTGGSQPATNAPRAWLAVQFTGDSDVPADHPDADRIRRVAGMALAASGGASLDVLDDALADPDGDVRRIATDMLPPSAEGRERIARALRDASPRVRVAALAGLEGAPRAFRCEQALSTVGDSVTVVALSAVDRLTACAGEAEVVDRLQRLAESMPAEAEGWHLATRAFGVLALLRASAAHPMLSKFAEHPNPFVRREAARAATALGARDALLGLSEDPHPIVRTAAIQGWAALRGRAGDPVLRAQLDRQDPELLMTAARLLEGTPRSAETVDALLGAFERLAEADLETARDARLELLRRIAELAGPEVAERLRPYLADFDPVVADEVASVLSRWDGAVEAEPRPHPPAVRVSAADLERLRRRTVVLELEGGDIEVLLFPDLAPTNAARFARLVAGGYYDGLTFHRVVPNFVVQGGSPGANEYAGADRYTRDEVGLESHWRGTVGLSTRGRDTGDGQIFINLVDNLRLDHRYTVFGEVVRGMDLVDRLLPGAEIRRAYLREDS